MLHYENAGVAKIIGGEELPLGPARPPNHHFISAFHLGFVKSPDKRGWHMTIRRVIVIAGTIKIGGHNGDKVHTKLPPISLRKLKAGNLRHRVPFIRRLQRAGEQQVLGHRLRRIARKDTG